MNPILQIIKQHPWATIFCLFYGLLLYQAINFQHRYPIESKNMDSGNRLAFGEGVAYFELFTIFIGIIFLIIVLITAMFVKGQRKFYLLLCLAVTLSILFVGYLLGF